MKIPRFSPMPHAGATRCPLQLKLESLNAQGTSEQEPEAHPSFPSRLEHHWVSLLTSVYSLAWQGRPQDTVKARGETLRAPRENWDLGRGCLRSCACCSHSG